MRILINNFIIKLKIKMKRYLMKDEIIRDMIFDELIGDAEIVKITSGYDNLQIGNCIIYKSHIHSNKHLTMFNNDFKKVTMSNNVINGGIK